MIDSQISERYGSLQMNETALEYFQRANLQGKSAEVMAQEFRAIQRFKSEELEKNNLQVAGLEPGQELDSRDIAKSNNTQDNIPGDKET